jgi:hypothetical protein
MNTLYLSGSGVDLYSRIDGMSLSGLQLSELCEPCSVKVESNVHLVKAQGGP